MLESVSLNLTLSVSVKLADESLFLYQSVSTIIQLANVPFQHNTLSGHRLSGLVYCSVYLLESPMYICMYV